MISLISKSWDDFQIYSKMYEGGEGIVYVAKEKSSGKFQVIKIFKGCQYDKVRSSVHRELLMIKKLKHPNIATYNDVFTMKEDMLSTKVLCYSMDVCWLGDLGAKVRQNHVFGYAFFQERLLCIFQ